MSQPPADFWSPSLEHLANCTHIATAAPGLQVLARPDAPRDAQFKSLSASQKLSAFSTFPAYGSAGMGR